MNAGQLRSTEAFPCVKRRCTPNVSLTTDALQRHCETRTGVELIECNTQSVNNFVTDGRAGIGGWGWGGGGDV